VAFLGDRVVRLGPLNCLEMSMFPVLRATMPWARCLIASVGLATGLSIAHGADDAAHVHRQPADAKPGAPAQGGLLISQAWIRPAVKGQSGTGGYMRLLSPQGGTLLGFASPVATAELHEMSMEGDVMRMRPLKALALPAGQPVDLKPGSYHLMLMNLKKPLKVGDAVPLTLKLQSADGKASTQLIKVPVLNTAPLASGAAAGVASMPEMSHMGHPPEQSKPAIAGMERMPKERKPQ
jgi:copper(I)-binding protein